MLSHPPLVIIPILVLLLLAACAAGAMTQEEKVHALGIKNAMTPREHLATGGQPTREQLRGLRDLGYRTVINLRGVGEPETGWEPEVARELGLTYVHIPVVEPDGVTKENAQRLADALAKADGGAFVYCRSGNRVGALLALKARFIDGASAEEALMIGRESGLTRLEPKIREMLGAN